MNVQLQLYWVTANQSAFQPTLGFASLRASLANSTYAGIG